MSEKKNEIILTDDDKKFREELELLKTTKKRTWLQGHVEDYWRLEREAIANERKADEARKKMAFLKKNIPELGTAVGYINRLTLPKERKQEMKAKAEERATSSGKTKKRKLVEGVAALRSKMSTEERDIAAVSES